MRKHTLSSLSCLLCLLLTAGLFGVPVSADNSSPPAVSAACAVLIDADSGRVIWQKNADTRHAMASTTKIMTALVAMQNAALDCMVSVDPAAVGIEGSSVYLYAGEQLTMEDLLYAMLLESANDAAAAIAIAVSGSIEAFAEQMNRTAAELGLSDTHFTNPHGLWDEAHYTTAAELARITMHALRLPAFRTIVSTYKTTIPLNQTEGTRLLINHNKMIKLYAGAIGVKTGFTRKSGRCLVSAAARDGVTLIAVTLDAPDDWRDHTAMLDYGFAHTRHYTLGETGTMTFTLPVSGGYIPYVTVANTTPLSVSLPADAPAPVAVLELPRFCLAPVAADAVLGRLIWRSGSEIVGESPLTATFSVEAIAAERGFLPRLKRLFGIE
ncbi:MAG: D-alanyl-D-alanine carboxypeptidase [Clostridia bacterium]|nr:D-alanyl-D-alanine carboxypeptidase [Clostridia bacterium]